MLTPAWNQSQFRDSVVICLLCSIDGIRRRETPTCLTGAGPFCWLICAICLALDLSSAYAQQAGDRLITGTVVASVQGQGKSDCPYLCGPFDGRALGTVIGIQTPTTAATQFVFEVSLPRSIQGEQSWRVPGGSLSGVTSHRDTIVNGMLGWTSDGSSVAASLVGGGSVASRNTTRRPIRFVSPGSFPPPGLRAEMLNDLVLGVVGGTDVRIRVSSRLFLMPTFRLHYLFDEDKDDDGVVKRGVGALIIRPGIGAGIRF